MQARSETQEANSTPLAGTNPDGSKKAADIIAALNARHKAGVIAAATAAPPPVSYKDQNAAEFSFELEINDFPQKARWKATNKVPFLFMIIEAIAVPHLILSYLCR